jgi:pimeloyl-ACP methyl ester carboxylesterase
LDETRKYGKPPYTVAVVHGGPGAAGEMAPVARELASERGVLEPLQSAASLEGQVSELSEILKKHAEIPAVLIGFSWGAWLSVLVAASDSTLARKLILIGSGPFDNAYAAKILETRLNRLSEAEKTEYISTIERLENRAAGDKDALLERLARLAAKTDGYAPDPLELRRSPAPSYSGAVYQNVWREAAELRKEGALLSVLHDIECPVVAIHGDYDPHPADGVRKPLASAIDDFRFMVLEKCGHRPWIEKHARTRFYELLADELKRG